VKSVSATEAKNRFGDLLSEAATQPVSIEKNGRVVAVLVPAGDYEHGKDAIALGRIADRILSGDEQVLGILREYSAGRRTRLAAIAALGLESYSQLLKALRRAALDAPTVPRAQQEAMIRDLAKIVRG
jgi:antitoxin Phd